MAVLPGQRRILSKSFDFKSELRMIEALDNQKNIKVVSGLLIMI
jgi:hypothetical protein